jgi:hypothetical protein
LVSYDLLSRKGLNDAYMLRNKLLDEMNKMKIEIKNEKLANVVALRQKQLQEYFHVNGVESQSFLKNFHTMRYIILNNFLNLTKITTQNS